MEGAAEVALRRHLSGTLSIVDAIAERYPEFVQTDPQPAFGESSARASVFA